MSIGSQSALNQGEEFSWRGIAMAEYVRIQKGGRELSVPRKAFNSVYKEKGFELVDAEQKDSSDGGSSAKGKSGSSRKS
jgi:hypothetical protein